MTLLRPSKPVVRRPESTGSTLLLDAGPGQGLITVGRRRRDAILAHLRGASLDRRLAAGEPPESSRLLAVRAAMLVTPRARESLARQWEEVAERARRPMTLRDPRVPVARAQFDAAADEVLRIVEALRADRPVSAAGVAAAGLMLTSGTSPVYGVRRGGADLPAAIARAISEL